MPMLHCYVDEATMQVLRDLAKERQRGETVEHLAEAAIANAACEARAEKSFREDRSR